MGNRMRKWASRALGAGPVDPADGGWVHFVFGHVFLVVAWVAVNLIFGTSTDVRGGHHVTNGNPLTSGSPPPSPQGATSLTQVHHWTHVPWPLWGAAFAVLAVLLLAPRSRPWAFLGLFFLSGFFVGTVLFYTYFAGHPTNSVTVPLGTLAPTMFAACFRYSYLGRVPRKRVSR